MRLYIVSTPYHLLYTSIVIRDEDSLVIVDNFNVENSSFVNLIMKNKVRNNNVFIINSLSSRKKNILRINKSIKEDVSRIIGSLKGFEFSEIITFNDVSPITQQLITGFKIKIDVSVIEEGIGLYRDTKKRLRFMHSIFGKLLFGINYEDVKRIGEYSKTTKILCHNPEFLSEIQKKKEIKVLPRIKFKDLSEDFNLECISNSYWFIGQPLVEDGVIGLKEYMEKLEKVMSICIKNNVLFIIKPHPREDTSKYEALTHKFNMKLIYEKDIPIELLIGSSDSGKVFTIYSSAALNIAIGFDIDVYMIYEIFNIEPNIPKELLRISKVKYINNWDELYDI